MLKGFRTKLACLSSSIAPPLSLSLSLALVREWLGVKNQISLSIYYLSIFLSIYLSIDLSIYFPSPPLPPFNSKNKQLQLKTMAVLVLAEVKNAMIIKEKKQRRVRELVYFCWSRAVKALVDKVWTLATITKQVPFQYYCSGAELHVSLFIVAWDSAVLLVVAVSWSALYL